MWLINHKKYPGSVSRCVVVHGCITGYWWAFLPWCCIISYLSWSSSFLKKIFHDCVWHTNHSRNIGYVYMYTNASFNHTCAEEVSYKSLTRPSQYFAVHRTWYLAYWCSLKFGGDPNFLLKVTNTSHQKISKLLLKNVKKLNFLWVTANKTFVTYVCLDVLPNALGIKLLCWASHMNLCCYGTKPYIC